MSDFASPIGLDYKTGRFGNLSKSAGVHLSETRFDFLGELASFADTTAKIDLSVKHIVSATEGASAFKIAANRWFLAGPKSLQDNLGEELDLTQASLIDLTHGRTSLLITGERAEWVLSKLYAIDFSIKAFPVGTGLSTTHHTIFTQIHRPYEKTFDLFVFRSFARSFWHTLTRAAEDVGYEVA
jgi:methylglutamate dehydrogenase subunit D